MKRIIPFLLAFLTLLPLNAREKGPKNIIDLSGKWEFSLDRGGILGEGFTPEGKVHLPGTTDTNLKGDPCEDSTLTTHLSRRFSYIGKAWYRRSFRVPRRLRGSDLVLTLERTKPTTVYLDGKEIGKSNDISTAQRFPLGILSKGKHLLTIAVDNSGGVPSQVISSSHMYSEDTQTNWNGIIGVIAISPEGTFPEKKVLLHSGGKLSVNKDGFVRDGKKEFLRGRHDACVFPLTGHTPMDYQSWKEYFRICSEYGLNHVRFHSWCPPEECFRAADEAGFILQPELPFWGTLDPADTLLVGFLLKEGKNILKEYSRHPSFSLFSLGNELWGDKDLMIEMIGQFREIAPDILYTNGSNSFLGYEGYVEGTDFLVTCRVGGEAYGEYGTHSRSSFSFADAFDGGILNHFHPSSVRDFSEALNASPVPVISHETGQFQTYPDYDEIGKYTGVLVPYNLEVFKQRLEDSGLGGMDKAFHNASGALSAILYKADIEMCLRTGKMGGFQLLDLQDYPGQGSAYVGILDAFMQDKGIAALEWWREFCSPVVPLALLEKFCWGSSEEFRSGIKVSNYSGEDLGGKSVRWNLALEGKEGTYAEGSLPCPHGEGLLEVGEMSFPLSGISSPAKAVLTVSIPGTDALNSWDIWIYPDSVKEISHDGITVAHQLSDEVLRALEEGGKVLYMPSEESIPESSPSGLFQTDYWNYRMFRTICENNSKPVSPGTLGLLIDNGHPLFKDFPTESHSSWQWFPVVKASHPLVTDSSVSSIKPIVRVIDNIERNHSLVLLFEARVGKGSILVCMSDLDALTESDDSPIEAGQFYSAVLRYMRSEDFVPSQNCSSEQLLSLVRGNAAEREIGELGNISYE